MRQVPTVATDDQHSTLIVTVDYHDGRGPQLSLSVPSGRLAGYPEARERGLAEARERIAAHVAKLDSHGWQLAEQRSA
jgi:hypothetical protein